MRNLYELYKRWIISENELNKVTQKEELEKINRLNKVYKNYNTKYHDWNQAKTALKAGIARLMYDRTKRSPMVLPIFMEI